MTRRLAEGVYEQLINADLRAAIDELAPRRHTTEGLDRRGDSHVRLARYLAAELERALDSLSGDDRLTAQVAFANRILGVVRAETGNVPPGLDIEDPAALLLDVYRDAPPPRPALPLGTSTLLTRTKGEPQIGHEISHEIFTADRVDALVSFVKRAGFRALRSALEAHAAAERPFRLMTTTYTGATDADAVDDIARLPHAKVKVSYDARRTRLHAKAWLFHRESRFSTAYVGSANLSQAALFGGHEWMVKVAEADLAHVIAQFRGTFDTLWENPEFEDYDPANADHVERLRRAVKDERGGPQARTSVFFRLRPDEFQKEVLDKLVVERELHGRTRNLVVAATGTGKTVVAAFDYARQLDSGGLPPSLLYLAHREEILAKSQDTFRHVLADESFGELLVGGAAPASHRHLFASIQSLASRDLIDRFGAEYWDHVIIDECHHAPAKSYREAMELLRPKLLVGLTATPERADGKSLLDDFGGHIAAELRLWHALERQLLAPFEYFGIHDGIDLSDVRWSRGAYLDADLERIYTGDDRRAALIISQFVRFCGDPPAAKALGFCVSVAHAEFMAARFNAAGIRAEAVHGGTPPTQRAEAPDRLKRGEVTVLFTCDLYNEGVDMPFVDTLLFLRPTASVGLFLQQLGRGLRLHPAKQNCLVLDFIGQHREEFRFDPLLAAITGVPRSGLKDAIVEGFPTLPSGCHLELDRVSREIILASVQSAVGGGAKRLRKELLQLRASTGHEVGLAEFLEATGRDVDDVYDAGGWTSLRRGAGLLSGDASPEEKDLNKRLGRIIHIDEPERLETWRRCVAGDANARDPVDARRILMLGYQLHYEPRSLMALDDVAMLFAAHPELRSEAEQLFTVLQDRVCLISHERPIPDWPLALHRHYTQFEIMTAVGHWSPTRKTSTLQAGVLGLPDQNIELLLVTLDKSGKHFSPTTRYHDYAISPRLFHWQTQGTLSVTSPTARRYLEQHSNRRRFVLFVRSRRGEPYAFLGLVNYKRHSGDRPINIEWELEKPMPAKLFQEYATLAEG